VNNVTDDQRDEAYKYFITALKRNSTYAPAFTSLGIYYSDFLSPPDPTRASKCFQKAFELDSREAYAARRLAEGFAEEQEWDLVEVVARRTIEGEGGINAGMKDGDMVVAGRYLPTNAWAWKAVGVVELVSAMFPFYSLTSCLMQRRLAGTIHPLFKHPRSLSEHALMSSCYGYV
jgi:superkiller protein 3